MMLTPDIKELARVAGEEHRLAKSSALEVVDHAVKAGRTVSLARQLVSGSSWQSWLDEAGITEDEARRYERLAGFDEEKLLNVDTLMSQLDGMMTTFSSFEMEDRDYGYQDLDTLERQRKTMTFKEMGDYYGMSASNISKRYYRLRSDREMEKLRAKEKAAYDREQARTAAKAAGLDAAYRHIRLALEAVQAVKMSHPDLETAMHALYTAEDYVVKASKKGAAA
jgi:hypothetical protein